MIRINNLSKYYGTTAALNAINICIGKGVIFGLLGPNGAGKTTLISILNGLTTFQEGEILVCDLPLRKNLREIRKRCTFIPQFLALYDNLSVIENLHFFAGIQNISGTVLQNNLDYAITTNSLEKLLKQKAVTLSGGQKRRLNIAIGLLNNPDILYFDEPTIGIDPESRNDILSTIRSLKKDNKTVVYTSHYMDEIEKICDEAAIINHGEIIAQGSLDALLQTANDNSAIIELHYSDQTSLHLLTDCIDTLQVIDGSTLKLKQQNSTNMSALLKILETKQIAVKQIRYQSMDLESLFITLTASENSHV